jgi:hypothetical protein
LFLLKRSVFLAELAARGGGIMLKKSRVFEKKHRWSGQESKSSF